MVILYSFISDRLCQVDIKNKVNGVSDKYNIIPLNFFLKGFSIGNDWILIITFQFNLLLKKN